ncbi:glucosamine-6-phosphate isomerase [candidate division KSB3 bacterium]|uniref:Glucosamine-6-phosphate isomerase n=1 Tax=candidate division KSB3 bacterium TaxID=2044937 RepID=A0A9D5JYH4_9BACT|nr:glucosamine-6-phosphate isomerase [candidate division KSB3 bacterium]MBD3326066.1 glucosamine-6-phosphate isomerase [candidate division KSB3 bacterium]
MRNLSKVAEGWWDYTTLDAGIIQDAARLTAEDVLQLSRPGFTIKFYDTLESFYVAEALEYVWAWQQATASAPTGICGPIGPTEQLPLVAQIVNDLDISLRHAHFWAMDEWYLDDKEVPITHPLSFAKADLDLCFNRIKPALRMPDEQIHFLRKDNIESYTKSYDEARCLIMQGGQGDVKHWAFNDPVKREGKYADAPPSPEDYRALGTRIVDLHPLTVIQNARTSGGGVISDVPSQAITVGPVETWKSDKVSIWHAGNHDNPFGLRLTTFMISKKVPDSSVPMSLLADHPNVQFNFYRPGIGTCEAEMH